MSRAQMIKAQNAVNAAIKRGQVERLPCAKCGELKTDAHHEDYSKPLDVVFLCRICHIVRHNEIRRENGVLRSAPRSPEIQAAILAAGSIAALAVKIGLSRQAIDQWYRIPSGRVHAVSAATGLPPAKLRPDLFAKQRAA